MSQQGALTTAGSGAAPVESLTGNTGGAVAPDAAFNINIIGNNTTGINVVGTPVNNTLTIVGIQATTAQRGTVTLATNAETLTGTDTSKVITPDDLKAKLGTQTLHGLPIGAGSTAALVWTAAPTNGQLLIGNTGNNPTLGNLTSTGGTITITNGAGTINLEAGSSAAIFKIAVETNTAPGVNPVLPDGGGQIQITSAQVATGIIGTNVIRTDAKALNAFTIEIQRSTAVAATDITKNGVSHFNSTQFTVDANGFVATSATGIINTLTGNSGGAISPTAGNINTLGTGSITIAGAGSTLTTQLTGLTNHAVLVGAGTATITNVGPTATIGQVLQSGGAAADPVFSTATYPLTTTISQILYSSAANTVIGLATANKGVLTTSATGVPVITALAADGQLIIGSTAGAPAAALLTAGTGIAITNGSNSISIAVNTATVMQTLTGNSGGAISPTAGNINTLGTGSITIAGAGSTLTTQLTGLTNHALQIGAGTATLTQLGAGSTGQILQTNTAADPTWSTATYPSIATGTGTILRADGTNWLATTSTYPNTNAVSTLLYASSANVMSALATANRAILTTGTTGIPALTALAVDGQLMIGSTAGAPAAATLTAGSGVTITNGSNSITIAVTGAGFVWTDVTGATQTLAVENGYVTDRGGGVTYTLPASASLGDEIIIVGKLGLTTIAQNANQSIRMSSSISTVGVGGSVVGTNVGDCITLTCTTSGASTVWIASSFVGSWTIT